MLEHDCQLLLVNLLFASIKHICIAYFFAEAKSCVLATSACEHISQRRYIDVICARACGVESENEGIFDPCTISLPWLIYYSTKSLGMRLGSLHAVVCL